MATDLLKNILTRIEKVAEIEKFPDWYITELKGFKKRWSTDMLVDVNDPRNPGNKKTESFKVVRSEHRTPDNRWITGGGFRFHPDVTLSQMESHAIEMSFKFWIMGIPHGGAKGGAAIDPAKYSPEDLVAITLKTVEEALEANTIGPFIDRWAPDIGTNEIIMKWIQDQYSYEMRKRGRPEPAAAVTGKPVEFGGIPGRKEATGLGILYGFEVFRKEMPLEILEQPTAILQGIGNVGLHFALFAEEHGIKIIAVQDQFGGVYHPDLPIKELISYVQTHPRKTVAGFHEICKGDAIKTPEELFSIKADIAVPAALEEAITPKIAELLKVKILLEGANGPTLPEAEPILEEKNIFVIPDIYVNSGGALVSYFEWYLDTHIDPFDILLRPPQYKDASLVFSAMKEAFARNGKEIIKIYKLLKERPDDHISPRLASCIYAMKRVLPFFTMKRRKY